MEHITFGKYGPTALFVLGTFLPLSAFANTPVILDGGIEEPLIDVLGG